MRKIKNLTLSLLSVITMSATNTATAGEGEVLNLLAVDSDLATYSASITGEAKKVGTGTVLMSGSSPSMTSLEINVGTIQASAASALGQLVDFTGGALEILANSTVNLPAVRMTSSGTITANHDAVSTIGTATGSGPLTLAAGPVGTGETNGIHVIGGNLSACTSTVAVGLGTDAPVVQAGGAGSATPSGAMTVNNGAFLQLVDVATNSITGAVDVLAGGTVQLDPSLVVPSGSDMFVSTVNFRSNSTLWLRHGSNWGKNIVVGTAG